MHVELAASSGDNKLGRTGPNCANASVRSLVCFIPISPSIHHHRCFFISSLRCALAVGLGLLCSLANAATLDDSFRRHADKNTKPSTGPCVDDWNRTLNVSGNNRDIYVALYNNNCLCGSQDCFTHYSKCLESNTSKKSKWITDDLNQGCDACKSAQNEDRIDAVVPRVVIASIHQASHHRHPSFVLDSSRPFICAFPLNLAIIQFTVSSSPLRQGPLSSPSVKFLRRLGRKRVKFPRRLVLVSFFVAQSWRMHSSST
ncbi:BZ3500_MvSof-1268-A1-R1_Chr7-3g09677 [Microbotryum saponariae]|uniref:BZ3500_MvSof-1268-A1-R1_Chr7-3g09677 protein n=1 Tax=Microbotryum saponariae TaxID=289078 RepID=A0A2X0LP88_9BASI|nr:BZ3501_MvSof-1269-A2-R1_Chr7-2g09400 [Microbotryum saponariae]SDA02397.1 BZ3500_MvSof-1268-A1-R1_Chr7-3g09677 [Microbotryum saponariae]